jgi:hypothetical protein
MARKRPARDPKPEQLVFPFQLRVGDVILEDGVRAEVVDKPSGMSSGKLMRGWLRREGETVQREARRGVTESRGGGVVQTHLSSPLSVLDATTCAASQQRLDRPPLAG